jgi:hypothetical protein
MYCYRLQIEKEFKKEIKETGRFLLTAVCDGFSILAFSGDANIYIYIYIYIYIFGARGSGVVEALCHKLEGPVFETQWGE